MSSMSYPEVQSKSRFNNLKIISYGDEMTGGAGGYHCYIGDEAQQPIIDACIAIIKKKVQEEKFPKGYMRFAPGEIKRDAIAGNCEVLLQATIKKEECREAGHMGNGNGVPDEFIDNDKPIVHSFITWLKYKNEERGIKINKFCSHKPGAGRQLLARWLCSYIWKFPGQEAPQDETATATKCSLWVDKNNTKAIKIYESFLFERTGQTKNTAGGLEQIEMVIYKGRTFDFNQLKSDYTGEGYGYNEFLYSFAFPTSFQTQVSVAHENTYYCAEVPEVPEIHIYKGTVWLTSYMLNAGMQDIHDNEEALRFIKQVSCEAVVHKLQEIDDDVTEEMIKKDKFCVSVRTHLVLPTWTNTLSETKHKETCPHH